MSMVSGRGGRADGMGLSRSLCAVLIVLLFVVDPLLAVTSPVQAKASDWGEGIGNVLKEQTWGFGSKTNLTLNRTVYSSNIFKLNQTAGSINTTRANLNGGTKTNITITKYDALVLTSKGTFWSRKAGWDLPDLPTPRIMGSPYFADIDNDGDYDAYVGTDNGSVIAYNNTGTNRNPNWVENTKWNISLPSLSYTVPALADLDNDGDLDLLVGDNNGKSFAYENTGNKTVPKWTKKSAWDALFIGGGAAPYLADLNNDGVYDVMIGDGGGYSNAMKNTGTKNSPTWSNQTSWNPPIQTNYVTNPAIGDLDADGDLDYLVGLGANGNFNAKGSTRAYENTGDVSGPTWTRNTNWDIADIGNYACPALVDIDGDGDLDVMVGEAFGAEFTYENLGVKPPTGNYLTGALDAGQYVNWSQVKWAENLPANTDVTISVRTGNSTDPTDGSWSAWSASMSTPGGTKIPSPPSRRIQIKAILTSTNNHATPTLWGMNVTYWHYLSNGTVTTNDLAPAELVSWNNLTATFNAKGETVKLQYSTDLGQTWNPVPANGNLTAISPASGHIRFMANISTTKPYATPEFTGFKLTHMIRLAPHHLHLSPASAEVVVNGTCKFIAELHDINNNTLNRTLNWTTDIGTVTADGLFTARKSPGTGHVNVSFGLHKASAIVHVLPGPLAKITVEPTAIITDAGKNTTFNASGLDAYDNPLNGLVFNWSTDVGTVAPAKAAGTIFTATTPPKGTYHNTTGNISAVIGNFKATAAVTILGETPPVQPVLTNLTISPKNATLKKGNTLQFKASGLDQFGKAMALSANWTSDVGTISPATGNSSTLTVTMTEGNGTVTAKVGALTATAHVQVVKNATGGGGSNYTVPFIKGRIPDQWRSEDSPTWTLDLHPFEGGGVPEEPMLWHIEGVDTTIVKVKGEYDPGDILTFAPAPEASGNDRATMVLEDHRGNRVTQAVWINITPVNDPPAMRPVPDLLIHYDSPYTFNYMPYISDIDTPYAALTMSVESTSPPGTQLTPVVTGLNVTYTAPKSMVGTTVRITLAVFDGASTVRAIIALNVSDDWVPKLIVPLPDVTLKEGETRTNVFDLDDHFTDQDKDVIFYTYGNNHVTITIHPDHAVDISASSEWAGKELVTFRATDSKGALVEDDVLVTVIPSNDPPVFRPLPAITVHYDSDYQLDLLPYITDMDTPPEQLVLKFSDQHVWWAWDPVKAADHPPRPGASRLTMVLSYPQVLGTKVAPYMVQVSLGAFDGTNTANGTLDVTVTDNWPPVLKAPMPDLEMDEDTILTNALRLSVYFNDPDGQALTYTTLFDVLDITIETDSTIDLSPPKDWSGLASVTFRATDTKGAMAEDTITVKVRPVNDPPVLDPLDPVSMDEKALANITLGLKIHDVDNLLSDLKVTVSTSAPSMRYFMSGLDVVLYSEIAGDYTVTITVTDPAGASSSQTVHVTVKATVKPPNPGGGNFMDSMLLPIMILILALIAAVGAFAVYRRQYGHYDIDDAFIVLKDGRPLSHLSRHPITKKDETTFSSMVAALQMFIEDAFRDMDQETSGTVQRMEFKGNNILVEKGRDMYLALIFTGTPGKKLYKDMTRAIEEIDERHGDAIRDWDGDVTTFAAIDKTLERFVPGGYTKPIKIEGDAKSKKEWAKVDEDDRKGRSKGK